MFETIHARYLGQSPHQGPSPGRKLRPYGEAERSPHIKRRSRDELNRFTGGKPRCDSVVNLLLAKNHHGATEVTEYTQYG